MTARQIEHPVADVLRVLAVSRSSGALEIRGVRGGTFFLHEGDITYAEALGVPPAEELDTADPWLPSTIQSSIVEVGLTLLAGDSADGERPLFRPGRRHASGRMFRVEVNSLLTEIAQQMEKFTKLGVEPDDEVQLCGLPPGRMAVLNRQQWALAAEMFGPETARSLARRSGAPLSVTIETVASLVEVGVVERGTPAPVMPASPLARDQDYREQDFRKSAFRDPATPRPVSPEVLLPHRVRGSTPLPLPPPSAPMSAPAKQRSSEARPGMAPLQDEMADSRALALRLLEGLRRL